jgi:thiamine biosynthesis protein ThiS
VKLRLNGELVEAPALQTVAELATWMQLPSFGSAVELNGEVIRRADHPTTPLKEGDCLEVVRLVGGG